MDGDPRAAGVADEELIAQAAAGDADAFEAVYDRHSRVVFSLAMRLLGDRQAAQDLAQESFVAAWRSAAAYSATRGSVRSWLLAITRNRGIDRLRGRKADERRQAALESEVGVRSAPGVDERAIARATAAVAVERLRGLPEEQRQAISLAYYGGYSHSEISGLLGVPLGTVKSRVKRGLDGLRRSMEGQEAR